MELTGYWEKNARVIILEGACDQSEWVVLEAAIVAAQIGQRHHIVLNLSAVTLIEPWIIGKLFWKYLQLRDQGVRLSLVNPPLGIRNKLERTNIPALVDYYTSDADALVAA